MSREPQPLPPPAEPNTPAGTAEEAMAQQEPDEERREALMRTEESAYTSREVR